MILCVVSVGNADGSEFAQCLLLSLSSVLILFYQLSRLRRKYDYAAYLSIINVAVGSQNLRRNGTTTMSRHKKLIQKILMMAFDKCLSDVHFCWLCFLDFGRVCYARLFVSLFYVCSVCRLCLKGVIRVIELHLSTKNL